MEKGKADSEAAAGDRWRNEWIATSWTRRAFQRLNKGRARTRLLVLEGSRNEHRNHWAGNIGGNLTRRFQELVTRFS
jgi:hypothetical protein